ncbi:translation initiation factor 2b subunit i family if-2bi [Lasius niger]|uniref:Translation initiation factor 2b subunit i family if-2bi n=1 Tax=Lasius niger TaxID=67767 RepID=A0A0J7JY21_LASNI|nr:translation initiation factor 2b subunit i family if-2bi [Lasius niger]
MTDKNDMTCHVIYTLINDNVFVILSLKVVYRDLFVNRDQIMRTMNLIVKLSFYGSLKPLQTVPLATVVVSSVRGLQEWAGKPAAAGLT